ncbi:MAG: DUF2207 domain-containing protein [Rhodocyclaceae bacterium]
MPKALNAFLLSLVLMALMFGFGPHAQAAEHILAYDVEIDIQTDGSLEVTEHITVRAEGSQIRRGIYRDFPTRYRDRYNNHVVVDFQVLEVLRDDQPEPWFTERLSNGVRINTGNDDLLPRRPGEYRYTLRYRTTRQLGFFESHDELYWNAIGTGWVFPIATGKVTARLPVAIAADRLAVEAYTGPQGARGQHYTAGIVEPGVAQWTLTRGLGPREGLTIVFSFPKGLIAAPDATQKAIWFFKDNLGILVALCGLVALLAFCIVQWRKVGRDPRAGILIARYEPPPHRSPAELRYLLRGRYDMRCLTGDLLQAAVAGQVTLSREARLLRQDRWAIEHHPTPEARALPDTCRALVGALFKGGTRTLALDNKQAHTFQAARSAHVQALDARLKGSHFNRNNTQFLIALAIAALTFVPALALSDGQVLVMLPGAAMVLVLIVFKRLIPAPTQQGRKLMDEAEGFKLYLTVAEREELQRLGGPGEAPLLDARRYEQLLPYAVALGVEEAWTKKFTLAVGAAAAAAAGAGIAWYRGGGMSDLGSLAGSLGSGLSSSVASASSPPGSSSGGGGGGGSGGGGGGGGGGGR